MNTVKEDAQEITKEIEATDAAKAADQGKKGDFAEAGWAADAEIIRRPRAHFRIRLVAASGESKANSRQKK